MANDETITDKKVPLSVKLDADVFSVVSSFAVDEDRSLSNMTERLLKTHPRVQEVLEAETATAAN
jgi:hypothetical protein